MVMAQSGNPAHFDSGILLALKDCARAKCIAAVHRQGMIENVKDTCHAAIFATTPLTPRQLCPAKPRRQLPERPPGFVIDYFALALSHLLIVVALIRMLGRDDLDQDQVPEVDELSTAPTGPQT